MQDLPKTKQRIDSSDSNPSHLSACFSLLFWAAGVSPPANHSAGCEVGTQLSQDVALQQLPAGGWVGGGGGGVGVFICASERNI